MVELVRSGRTPEELSREFEPTAQSISNWVRQADRDAGRRNDDATSAERDEPVRLRRELGPLRRELGPLRRERDILANAAAWFALGERGDPERVYRFMSAHQAIHPIRVMARRMLKVSASGYYAWRRRPASARATADADLTRRIRTIHAALLATDGAPRIHAELRAEGVRVGRKRVARLMREASIAGVSHRRGRPVTTRPSRRA